MVVSLKRHLFPHGGRESKAFWICFSRVHPPSEIKSNFKFKTLKRHLLKRHLTLSEIGGADVWEVVATKHVSVKKKVFSLKRGEAFSGCLAIAGFPYRGQNLENQENDIFWVKR